MAKLCVDCKHCKVAITPDGPYLCKSPSIIRNYSNHDPVTGKTPAYPCFRMRENWYTFDGLSSCGVEGIWWEQKEPQEKQKPAQLESLL